MLYRLIIFLSFFSYFSVTSQNAIQGFVDGKIYVKFKKNTLAGLHRENPKDIPLQLLTPFRELIAKYNVTRVNKPFYQATDDEKLMQIYKFHFADASKVSLLIDDLYKITEVEYAEKIPISVPTATPNDFAILSSSVHLNQINAPQAWDVFNGNSNITVAIIDNAVMWTHADLVQNTYTNTFETAGNGIDDDGNGYIDDINGWNVADDDNNAEPTNFNMVHGTHVAGIAGARNNNGIGVSSIGWNIKIIPVQCQADGASPVGIDYAYEGVVYAARSKARVINCSWGNSISPSVTEQTIIDYAWNKGCIIIAAAGNSGTGAPYWPAAYNHVYAVTAVDQNDIRWNSSSYYSAVDISAPGTNIMSTYPYSSTPAYGLSDGTSMSSPMVAGLAALMLSRSPNMTQQDVLNCISTTAANIYTLTGNSSYSGMLGAGRINAAAAMSCAATYSVMPPVAGFFASELYVCPNTPVQFNDSSQYVPTAWSWTFQGGNPATSTLAHPVVQYATPGTYSAALTVSNSSGSSTKTKLVYITVAGSIALPLYEGFEQPQFLPSNWTAKNINNDAAFWERITGIGAYGTSTACAVFDNFTWRTYLEREEMRTPKYDFTKVSVAHLKFDVAYARFNAYYSDSLEVKMSNNCGASWTGIYLEGGTSLATTSDQSSQFVPASNEWRTEDLLLSNVAGQNNVTFSFINRGRYGQPIYLDNINLTFPMPTVTATYPASICAGQTITYTSTTLGSTNFTWNVGGSASSGSTATRTYSVPGVYVGTLSAQNGTSIASKTLALSVFADPTLTVTHPTICSGTSGTIQANGANSYLWAGGGNTSSLQVSPSATTVYTVTGINGGVCSSIITSTVSVIISPTVSVSDQTVCAGSSATLTASGAGSYTWNTGAGSSSIVITPSASAVYTVTGSNSFCTHTRTVNLATSLPINATLLVQNVSCASCNNGSITITATGIAPLIYSWTPSVSSGSTATELSAGCYTVVVTDGAGCNETFSSCVQTSVPSGVAERDLQNLVIYPNPAQSSFNVENDSEFKLTLINQLGQVIFNGNSIQNKLSINIENYAPGVYYIQVENSRGLLAKKIIVE
jgi:serine protease